MARKLNADESRVFSESLSGGEPLPVASAEMILRDLAERRDRALELPADSPEWLKEFFPPGSGQRH